MYRKYTNILPNISKKESQNGGVNYDMIFISEWTSDPFIYPFKSNNNQPDWDNLLTDPLVGQEKKRKETW